VCGTYGGYQVHKKAHQEACEPCVMAHNAYKKAWRERNSTSVKQARSKNYRLYPERAISRSNKRRAVIQGVEHTKYAVQEVLEVYGTLCHICDEPVDLQAPRFQGIPGWELGLHIDHLIPISKGGPDILENVRPSHGICNIRKHDNSAEVSE
jgi:5-methylcytosine-specific restriction endonuclease McrA